MAHLHLCVKLDSKLFHTADKCIDNWTKAAVATMLGPYGVLPRD